MVIRIRNAQRRFKIPARKLEYIASIVLGDFNISDLELSIFLVNDRRIRELNRHYRNMDKATDVLAFAMQEGTAHTLHPECLGDVIISVERAFEQAREKSHPLLQELTILLIHGILHLLGYDHEKSPRKAALMKRKERIFLKRASGAKKK